MSVVGDRQGGGGRFHPWLVSIVCSDFVLSVLRNADGRHNADDRNYDQQFDECET